MQIILEVIEGPHRGRKFSFDRHDTFIVGRARCAHFRLPKQDRFFSRAHFMIESNPPHCRLIDMGSANGTMVNGQRVQVVDLKDGDLIQGGNTVLRVSFVADADLPTSATQMPPGPAKPPPLPPQSPSTTETHLPAHLDLPPEAAEHAEDLPPIEGYRIVKRLGQGGMGVVYLAARSSDAAQVALKTIRPTAAGSELEVQRFLREAGILRRLRHRHIVAFHEMGRAGELIYFVMDYVPGADAGRLLKRQGPLAIARAVRLVCQALDGLDYAHRQGIVHRDVKPSNLLVSQQEGVEVARLADFGLAHLYQSSPLSGLTLLGDVAGTTPYMPPEQITDFRHVSPAADQYSLAAALYRLLTGCFLYDFEGLPTQERMLKILFDEPVAIRDRRQGLPAGLPEVIHRALQKDATARFPHAAALRDALLPFAAFGVR